MMRDRLGLGFLGAVMAVFFVLFWWAYPKPTVDHDTRTSGIMIQGRYEQYSFGVAQVVGKQAYAVNFSPALKPDDMVVLGALRQVMTSVYGDRDMPDLRPTVETVNERNYLTFTVDEVKTWFELFKNAQGEVGSASFWRESVKK